MISSLCGAISRFAAISDFASNIKTRTSQNPSNTDCTRDKFIGRNKKAVVKMGLGKGFKWDR